MDILSHLQLARLKIQQAHAIRRNGWIGVYVGEYRRPPAWAYTIGFDETLDHPEIVLFDVPQASANEVMWRVFSDVKSGALVIEDGLVWPPGDPIRLVWRKVHPWQIDQWLNHACIRRHRRAGKRYGLEAYQLVLPDPQGVLPWEPGYEEDLRPRQPALYEPPATEALA